MPDQPDDITRLRKASYALEDLPETIAFPQRAGDEPREPLQVVEATVDEIAFSNLADMPRLDLLVVDEAHHAVADSYRRIIDRVREANPDARIFGVTATPNRGDKKGLREIFDNVADQVRLGELIASGHLVPPRTFVIDVGVQDAIALAVLLFLFALRRSGERAGRLAERLETTEKVNDVQRRMLEAAARRPRDRDDLTERMRDGRF